jgi:hypothetical protein
MRQTGAVGELESVYFRNPDLNLIEVATRISPLFQAKKLRFYPFFVSFLPL